MNTRAFNLRYIAFVLLNASLLLAITANLGEEKFFAYGGPDYRIDTELRGTVVRISGDDVLLAADGNYYSLGLLGNVIRGTPNETGTNPQELCYAGPDILGMIGSSPVPIIKLEMYGIAGRPSSEGPLVVRENGVVRPLRVADRIKVSGLYAIDYSHPPYCDLHTASWTYMRGFYKAAYAHAELHPYLPSSIELIRSEDQNSEVHTVVAPVYPELYSKTYWWNKLFGLAGHMVDSAKRVNQRAVFFLSAPPRPAGDVELTLLETEVVKTGDGFTSYEQYMQDGHNNQPGITVVMKATGTDIYNPALYKARFTVVWQPRRPPTPPQLPPDRLKPRDGLVENGSIVSQDGRFRLTLQDDGNLVLYGLTRALWASNTVNRYVSAAIMQDDGNFVLYDAWRQPLWASHTHGHPGAYLILQNDGNLVLYDPDNRPLWASNTHNSM